MRYVLLVAIAIRVFVLSTTNFIPASDQRDYHVLAKNLYDGEGYIQIYQGESEQFKDMVFRAYRMPGYPFVLAGFYKLFGPDPQTALWLNLVFDIGSLVLIYLIAKLFGGGLIAPTLFAITPLWTPLLMTESLFTMMFLGITYLVLVQGKSLLTGLLLAIAVMVRPVAICLVPIVLFKKRSLLTLLPLVLVLALWNLRNYKVFNEPVLLSTNFGPHNSPDFGIDKVTEIKRLKALGFDEVGINKELTNQIKEKVKENPKLGVSVYVARLKQLFSTEPPSELRSLLWKGGLEYPEYSKMIVKVMPYFYLLSLFSLPLCLYRYTKPTLILLVSSISFILLHPFVSHGNLRFFAPLFPLLCIFVGGAWKR